jgi:hypothetical protein
MVDRITIIPTGDKTIHNLRTIGIIIIIREEIGIITTIVVGLLNLTIEISLIKEIILIEEINKTSIEVIGVDMVEEVDIKEVETDNSIIIMKTITTMGSKDKTTTDNIEEEVEEEDKDKT